MALERVWLWVLLGLRRTVLTSGGPKGPKIALKPWMLKGIRRNITMVGNVTTLVNLVTFMLTRLTLTCAVSSSVVVSIVIVIDVLAIATMFVIGSAIAMFVIATTTPQLFQTPQWLLLVLWTVITRQLPI